MKLSYGVWLAVAFLGRSATPARAAVDYEVSWRSQLGYARAVAVDPFDHTIWIAGADEVTHVTAEGTVLQRLGGFLYPCSLAVLPSDGSLWVADDGTAVRAQHAADCIVHLAADGTELWRGTDVHIPHSAAVDPGDGACWLGEFDRVTRLSVEGDALGRNSGFSGPVAVALDPATGRCWAGDYYGHRVTLLDTRGDIVWSDDSFTSARSFAVHPYDRSVWIADFSACQVARLAFTGDFFGDVLPGHWAYDAIQACAANGTEACPLVPANPLSLTSLRSTGRTGMSSTWPGRAWPKGTGTAIIPMSR